MGLFALRIIVAVGEVLVAFIEVSGCYRQCLSDTQPVLWAPLLVLVGAFVSASIGFRAYPSC